MIDRTRLDDLETAARDLFRAAVASAAPDRLIERAVATGAVPALEPFRRVIVLACGKAALPMTDALASSVGRIDAGLITSTETSAVCAAPDLEVMAAAHPVPDERSERAGRRALELAGEAEEDDLLIVLLSGGGSALWEVPAPGLELTVLQQTVQSLLHAGADIHELNTVRKHLSAIKGGRLAAAAAPATIVTLIISDVVGDDPSTIASGPTVPDPTTFADALSVLDRRRGRSSYPSAVVDFLLAGRQGRQEETPGPGSEALRRSSAVVIGSNRDARRGAADRARSLGFAVCAFEDPLTGEAAEAGRRIVDHLKSMDVPEPTCVIWGGETTVTVTGDGRGGRNQELALSAAIEMAGWDRRVVVLSGGTDGIDGPTDAAGATVTPQTVPEAIARSLDAAAFLAANDSNSFFEQQGRGLVKTGPTRTNVTDVQIALIDPS